MNKLRCKAKTGKICKKYAQKESEYCLIHSNIMYQFGKNKKNTNFLFILFYFLIPLIFFLFFIKSNWSETVNGGMEEYYMGSKQGYINLTNDCGNISITRPIDFNTIQKISYTIGTTLDLPIIKMCFYSNGTTYQDTLESTFNSTIIINNKIKFSIPFKGKTCYPLNYEEGVITYCWNTFYNFTLSDRRRSASPFFDGSSSPILYKQKRFDDINIIITCFVMLIAYWGICQTISNVIKELIKMIK